jgi:hypothetical protein
MGAVSDLTTVLRWPKSRTLRDGTGAEWTATLEPGRLDLIGPDGCLLTVTDPDDLRAFAMQCYAAAIEYDLAREVPPGRGRAHLKRQRRRHADATARRRLAGEPLHLFRTDPR